MNCQDLAVVFRTPTLDRHVQTIIITHRRTHNLMHVYIHIDGMRFKNANNQLYHVDLQANCYFESEKP